MSTYLIDYENVMVGGLKGLSDLAETDDVYIFYTENADRLTFGVHQKLSESPAHIFYLKVEAGTKNALDFQLTTYLGYLVAKKTGDSYAIVSKDKGFASVVEFWKKGGVNVSLVADLTGGDGLSDFDKQMIQALADYPGEAQSVVKIVAKYKTKQGVNNALVKSFGNEKASGIYKIIRPLLSDKKDA